MCGQATPLVLQLLPAPHGDGIGAQATQDRDVLAEVMNAKAATPLEAPASGRLTILVAAEVPVRCGELIARID